MRGLGDGWCVGGAGDSGRRCVQGTRGRRFGKRHREGVGQSAEEMGAVCVSLGAKAELSFGDEMARTLKYSLSI